MKKAFFHFVVIFVVFASCKDEPINRNSRIVAEQSSCCQNLEKDTITYQPKLDVETMHYLHGHIDGMMNEKAMEGYCNYAIEENNELHFMLLPWDNSSNKLIGMLHINGKMQCEKVFNVKELDVFYTHNLPSCQSISYYVDSTKTTFLKYVKVNDKRINGCFSGTFYKSNNSKNDETQLLDTISFKNIRFSAIMKEKLLNNF